MNTGELFSILTNLALAARVSPDIETTACVNLTGADPAQWNVSVKEGQIKLAHGEPLDEPELTVTVSSDTAISIYEKKISPMMAFMTGKIKISGDIGKIGLLKDLILKKK